MIQKSNLKFSDLLEIVDFANDHHDEIIRILKKKVAKNSPEPAY